MLNSFFALKNFYFDEKVFKLQIWRYYEKSRLHDVRKFDKVGQPLTIFLYDGTIQVSKIFSLYLYNFTVTWKIVNFGIKRFFAFRMTDFQLFHLVFVWLS